MSDLTRQDKKDIARIREEIKRQGRIRDRATAEIHAQHARLVPYQDQCQHPNGYETSCMGDSGFRCEECGYER